MSPQPVKAKVLAISLFIGSICGTFGLFGCVPLLAQLISSDAPSSPQPWQRSPGQFGALTQEAQPLKINRPRNPGRTVVKEHQGDAPSRRPTL